MHREGSEDDDWPAYSYWSRSVATAALVEIRNRAQPGDVLGVVIACPASELRARGATLTRKAVARGARALSEDLPAPLYLALPWVDACCVALGPDGSQEVLPELGRRWAEALGVPPEQVEVKWTKVAEDRSVSDMIEGLTHDMVDEPETPGDATAVMASSSVQFLIDLVSPGGGESVLREAVALLLDAGNDMCQALAVAGARG